MHYLHPFPNYIISIRFICFTSSHDNFVQNFNEIYSEWNFNFTCTLICKYLTRWDTSPDKCYSNFKSLIIATQMYMMYKQLFYRGRLFLKRILLWRNWLKLIQFAQRNWSKLLNFFSCISIFVNENIFYVQEVYLTI